MSGPGRFSDDPDAPRVLLDMLESAKAVRPTITEKVELGARLGVTTAGGFALPLAKWVAGGLLVAGGGLALLVSSTQTPSSESGTPIPAVKEPARVETVVSAQAVEPAPVVAQEEEESALVEVKPAPKAAVIVPSVKKELAHPSGAGKSAQPSEAQLLSAARGLISKDPKGALSILAQHESLYPHGILGQEREVLRVRALKEAGQLNSAQKEAEEFRKAHPDSAHTTSL